MLLVLSLSLALFLGGVVDVSAAGLGYFSSQGPLMDDATATIGPLKSSQVSKRGRELLDKWRDGSSDLLAVCYEDSLTGVSGASRSISFIEFQNSIESFFFLNSSGELRIRADSYKLYRFSGYKVSFSVDTGDCVFDTSFTSSSVDGSYFMNFIQYRAFSSIGLTSAYPNIWKPVKESPTGAFTVIFDDEAPPTPSEPDPPAPSEPDPPPPVSYPDFPVVGPTDNRYIPYDTTVWNQFAGHIKKTLGALVPVCLICLSIILGIRVVVKLVNHFAK